MKIIIEADSISVIRKNEHLQFNYDDIDYIIVHPSGTSIEENLFSAAGSRIYWGCYHFMRIVTYSKEEIIITCIMHPYLYKVFDEFKGVKIYRYNNWFPTTLIK